MNSIALVYIAGPYRPANGRSIDENVQVAEAAACDLIRSGARVLPIVPHSIGLRYSYLSPDGGDEGYWLPATLTLMERCHAVFMLPDWRLSTGATAERARALELGLPVFESVAEIVDWAAVRSIAGPETRACVTCRKPAPCGCPGEGWPVPVHVRAPAGHPGLWMAAAFGPCPAPMAVWDEAGHWSDARSGRSTEVGARTFPLVPFLDGRPVWIDPWVDAAPSVPQPPTASQVTDLLRRAARGEVPVACRGDRRWTDLSGFTVPVVIDGWVLHIHNDCGEADYIAQVTAPSGAVADYDTLCAGRGPLYLGPLEDLSEDDLAKLERVLDAAPLEAP